MKIRTYSFKAIPGPITTESFFDFLLSDEKGVTAT